MRLTAAVEHGPTDLAHWGWLLRELDSLNLPARTANGSVLPDARTIGHNQQPERPRNPPLPPQAPQPASEGPAHWHVSASFFRRGRVGGKGGRARHVPFVLASGSRAPMSAIVAAERRPHHSTSKSDSSIVRAL